MRRLPVRILRFIIAAALVPVVLAILALLVINVVDWDKHRGFVTHMVERFTDYKIESIEGIKVGLLRSAEIGVDRIALHHKTGKGALKSYESGQFYYQMRVFPILFENRLVVQNFILDGARIVMQPSREEPKEKTEDEEKPITLADLPGIFIQSASIRDSSFRYEGQGEPILITLANAGMTTTAADKPALLSAEGEAMRLPFEVLGAFGSFDAFRDRKAAYPARIQAKVADQSIEVRGKVDIAADRSDFDVDLSGPGIDKLKSALRLNIGTIPPYTLSFALKKKPDVVRFEEIQLQYGDTRVIGNGGLDFSNKRLLVQADLKSPLLHAKDFKGLFQTAGDTKLRDQNEPPKPEGQYFSDKPLEVEALKKIDADVQIAVDHFDGEKAGTAIDAIFGRVQLNAGRLVIKPLRFDVARGSIGGDLTFDARRPDIQVAIELGAREIDLDSLLGRAAKEVPVMNMKPGDMAKGMLTGHLKIDMHGRTPMQLAKTVKGPVQLAVEDGQLSATLIELAGIDITETIGDWILKHPLKSLECGLLSFEANEGVYATKSFIIATKDSNVIGSGQLNLPGNDVNFRISVHPRDFSIGSVRSPILIRGPLNDIGVGLDPKPLIAKGAAAIVLGAVNPALALLPLVEPGLSKKGGCSRYKGELQDVIAKAEESSRGSHGRQQQSVVR